MICRSIGRKARFVYILPKQLVEQLATLHLPALGAKLTVFAQEDVDYTVVKLERLSRSTRSKQGRLLHQRHFLSKARCRGVGTPSWAGPLTTSLRGLWVSGYLPRAMADRAQGRQPENRPGGDDSDPGLASRRERDPTARRGTLKPAWSVSKSSKGKGPKDPGASCKAQRGNCRPQLVQADFLFPLLRFQFHLRPDVPDAYSGNCSLVLARHGDTSVRQHSVMRTLKPCPSRIPALWRIEDCSCVTLIFCVIKFGAVPDERVCNLWSLLRRNHFDFLLFWTILNFAGFRKFLMTASR